MRILVSLPLFIAILLFGSCNEAAETNPVSAPNTTEAPEKVIAEDVFDTLAVVEKANALRSSIEGNLGNLQLIEIGGDKLRAKTKQKWSKIHFYKEADAVVRIKTYPHANVSQRTEEFYFENGQLTLVVVEDDGAGARGKPLSDMDRVYYFHNGNAIKEINKSEGQEYSSLKAEGEELLAEAAEYLELLKTK